MVAMTLLAHYVEKIRGDKLIQFITHIEQHDCLYLKSSFEASLKAKLWKDLLETKVTQVTMTTIS